MEMHLGNRHSVDFALRLGNQPVNRQHIQLHHGGNGQLSYQMFNLLHAAVAVMVGMAVCCLPFLLAVDLHPQMGAGNAALHRLFPGHMNAGNAQAVQPLHKPLRVGQQLQQRRGKHISGSPHAAVDVQGFHFFASIWLIRLARNPAPNPLSMFTTLTPLAQELSMLSRALTPPKDAP